MSEMEVHLKDIVSHFEKIIHLKMIYIYMLEAQQPTTQNEVLIRSKNYPYNFHYAEFLLLDEMFQLPILRYCYFSM